MNKEEISEAASDLIDSFIPTIRKYKTEKPLFSERRMALEVAIVCTEKMAMVAPGMDIYPPNYPISLSTKEGIALLKAELESKR